MRFANRRSRIPEKTQSGTSRRTKKYTKDRQIQSVLKQYRLSANHQPQSPILRCSGIRSRDKIHFARSSGGWPRLSPSPPVSARGPRCVRSAPKTESNYLSPTRSAGPPGEPDADQRDREIGRENRREGCGEGRRGETGN